MTKLAHRYFDTSRPIIERTVTVDLAQLVAAVRALLEGLERTP
jgi:uncharacterized protein with HEPN domain